MGTGAEKVIFGLDYVDVCFLYYRCSLPVAVESKKASAEPAWRISGFFVPIGVRDGSDRP